MSELQKQLEKVSYKHFCHNVFVALTCRLSITGQLESQSVSRQKLVINAIKKIFLHVGKMWGKKTENPRRKHSTRVSGTRSRGRTGTSFKGIVFLLICEIMYIFSSMNHENLRKIYEGMHSAFLSSGLFWANVLYSRLYGIF